MTSPKTAGATPAVELPDLENIDLTYLIAGKIAEFYPQETPRDMEKNHRLARAIQRLPALRQAMQVAITTACQANTSGAGND